MDWLSRAFELFDKRVVSLDEGRVGRIKAECAALSNFVREDGPLAAIVIDLYLQGSVAIGTAIRPAKAGRAFDGDVVLILDVTKRPKEKQSPAEVIAWLAARLRNCPRFKDKVRERPRCVRIESGGDFHLDVVPGHPIWGSDVILVPNKKSGWRKSNPKGYISWALSVEEKSQGQATVVIRLSKFWRDLKFAEESKPKSILLTALVGRHTPMNAGSTPEALVLMLESLDRELREERVVPTVPNPSLPEENLARDWPQEAFELFCLRLKSAAEKARAGYQLASTARERSTRIWLELFGERFPKHTEEDGHRLRQAASQGSAYVSAIGGVSSGAASSTGTAIQQHRFYGSENSATRT